MFEWDWIDDLDVNQVADELARVRDLEMTAAAGKFLLAARWADENAPEFVDDLARQLPGMPKAVRVSEDCPEIDEFAGAELAALLGLTTQAGERLIGDALLVRHRHPRLWERIKDGTVRTWVAAEVARRCAAADLDAVQAAWVDAATTPYVETLPTKRFLDLVEAKIIEADPAAAEERARAEALRRFVRSGAVDEHGMKTLVARAHAGDVTYLVAVLDRIAVILAERGDHTALEVRRTTALRILANPARALALLTEATLEQLDPAFETCEGTDEEKAHAEHPSGGLAWACDASGGTVPGSADLIDVDLDTLGIPGLADLLEGSTSGGAAGAGPAGVAPEAQDPELLRHVLNALEHFDATRLDPVTVFHVHVTDTTLESGAGPARVEELGAAALAQVRDWLTHPMCPDAIRQQVRVRPVLDADAVRPVDAYEWPTAMSDLATARNPYEVFPYGTRSSSDCEDDHVIPFRRGRSRQTRLSNNAKLGKRHHRIKTFGGWLLHHPQPGVYLWRTRHGHWLRVDATGTHHLGRDPALNALPLADAVPA